MRYLFASDFILRQHQISHFHNKIEHKRNGKFQREQSLWPEQKKNCNEKLLFILRAESEASAASHSIELQFFLLLLHTS